MNPDVLKIMAVVAGALVASPFMLASFRAFFFFGEMSEAAKRAEAAINRTEKTVTAFIVATEETLSEHDSRITTIEAERRTELRYGRRVTDTLEPRAVKP